MDEVMLNNDHIGHFIFQEAVDNELIVGQNVEVGNDVDSFSKFTLIPITMIKQEDIVESSEAIIGSNVDNEVINDHFNKDRFVTGSSIEMGSDQIDDGTFEDTKLNIDTENDTMDEATLKKHIKSMHGKYQRGKFHMMVYKDDMLTNKRYSCPTCSYTTRRRDKLDKHIKKHVLRDGVHPCGKKRYKPEALPQRHRHNAEEYKCPQCSYSCTVYKAMKKHLKQHAAGTNSYAMKISCKICGKDRITDGDMQNHMTKHQDGKNFLCDICSFSSMQLKKIIQHRRIHTGEKPHLCPHCNYRSTRRDCLRSHVRRMHKKENMYIDTFNPSEDTV